jgi:hypothetical protein
VFLSSAIHKALAFSLHHIPSILLTSRYYIVYSSPVTSPIPWHLFFGKVNGEALTGASHISDEKAIEAMKIAFTEFKLVLEPSGALGLAALLNGDLDGHIQPGDCVGVVACGGNVSLGDYVKFVT